MIVIFDRQYYGKPNQNDLGAGVDLDADVLVDIQARIANGEATPVLASHLDALGIRDAVEAWARSSE